MVNRDLYMDKIDSLMDLDLIKVITGVRRCGKSYMLHLIKERLIEKGVKEENIFLFDFESSKYKFINDPKELDDLVFNSVNSAEGKVYLFFDEIQDVPMWEKCINGYRVDLDCDIYITGSNSKMLSGELATYLTGRYVEIKMYPFSFKEFITFQKEDNGIINYNIEKLFEEYMKYGGFPLIARANHDVKLVILGDIYRSILLEDLVRRYRIKDISLAERVLKFIIDNAGNTFSAKSIYNYLKHEDFDISYKTVSRYANCFANVGLISKVQREDLIGKKLLNFCEKYYVVDVGLNQVILGKHNPNIGRIIENIVYLEFLRRGYEVTVGKIKNYEIDFVCKKDGKKFYVQVSYLLSDENIVEREFRPLLQIKDRYPTYVISMDKFDLSNDGIIHLNLFDFLLDDSLF